MKFLVRRRNVCVTGKKKKNLTIKYTYFNLLAEVTTSMVEAEDTVRAIRHLTENFGEQAEEYPLVITRPEFKKFKVRILFNVGLKTYHFISVSLIQIIFRRFCLMLSVYLKVSFMTYYRKYTICF